MSLSFHGFFFFFKQKTAYEMRISDWSSDVCSSDLRRAVHLVQPSAYSGGNTGAFRRKRLYLARHNRKAPPGVTGPRSLYGGLERQQVGLLRDLSYVARGLADQIHRMEQQLHLLARAPGSQAERRVGRECASTCRSR